LLPSRLWPCDDITVALLGGERRENPKKFVSFGEFQISQRKLFLSEENKPIL
jgi:hypothetical protein